MTGMGQPAFTPGELESIIDTYTAEQATITAKINENAQDIREAEREIIILANANLVLHQKHLANCKILDTLKKMKEDQE